MGFEPIKPSNANANKLSTNIFANRMKDIQKILRVHMLLAQADHEKYADQHRATAPRYNIGEMVWLDTKNLFTKRPCRKMKNCRAGPYLVKRVISAQAIKLNLPENIRIHLVFYINLLKPAATNPHPGHIPSPPPPIKVDRETKWKVKAIVDSCYF